MVLDLILLPIRLALMATKLLITIFMIALVWFTALVDVSVQILQFAGRLTKKILRGIIRLLSRR